MSNQPNNKQVSIMAIACVSVIAITMMVLTAMMNVASAQAWQSFQHEGDFGESDTYGAVVTTKSRDCSLDWQQDVYFFVKTWEDDNSSIVAIAGNCFFDDDGWVTFTFEIDGEFETREYRSIGGDGSIQLDITENQFLLLVNNLVNCTRFKVEAEYDNQFMGNTSAVFTGQGSTVALSRYLNDVRSLLDRLENSNY